MPVPFRDAGDIEALGAAGYLKFASSADGSVVQGALFVVNARGEPLEFTYNQVETPNTFLWRQEDIRLHAVRMLVTSILTACAAAPQFILCLAGEVPGSLFVNDVHLAIPAGRIASRSAPGDPVAEETQTTVAQPELLQLFWYPAPPADGSTEHRLLQRLLAHGLLLDPFERAAQGLKEVYSGALERLPS